jgi:cyanophycinase
MGWPWQFQDANLIRYFPANFLLCRRMKAGSSNKLLHRCITLLAPRQHDKVSIRKGDKMGKFLQGTLMLVGGAEDKKGKCEILSRFVQLSGGENSRLMVVTAASQEAGEVGQEYVDLFDRLGAGHIESVNIFKREQASETRYLAALTKTTGVYFTGGDQLRLTSLLGGTGFDLALHRAYQQGTVIGGTSAGASVMSETMIVEGDEEEAPKKNTVRMSPGMGLISGVVVDQHFAQRGRLGRLLASVAQNPCILGLGLDEDTAVIAGRDDCLQVLGSQTVTIVDGQPITSTNVSESGPSQPLALMDVLVHVLPAGFRFDLKRRRPVLPEEKSREAG